VTLLQETKAYGAHIESFPVHARERWPRHQHENCYWLQEDYLRYKQQGKDWHWMILRPHQHALNIPMLGSFRRYAQEHKNAASSMNV
jgi:hypothetical protein